MHLWRHMVHRRWRWRLVNAELTANICVNAIVTLGWCCDEFERLLWKYVNWSRLCENMLCQFVRFRERVLQTLIFVMTLLSSVTPWSVRVTLKCKCVKVCCTCMAGCDTCYDFMVVIIVSHGGTYMVNMCDSFGSTCRDSGVWVHDCSLWQCDGVWIDACVNVSWAWDLFYRLSLWHSDCRFVSVWCQFLNMWWQCGNVVLNMCERLLNPRECNMTGVIVSKCSVVCNVYTSVERFNHNNSLMKDAVNVWRLFLK